MDVSPQEVQFSLSYSRSAKTKRPKTLKTLKSKRCSSYCQCAVQVLLLPALFLCRLSWAKEDSVILFISMFLKGSS